MFWDLSKAKFGSGPEPESGFYIAVVIDGEIALLVGDSTKAYSKIRAQTAVKSQVLFFKREHVVGNRIYTTKARIGGKSREISIDCRINEDAKLCFSIDKIRVLEIKRLKWKFRGNEKIEVDGIPIQVSWDVHNWLFNRDLCDGHAVFMFKFEDSGEEEEEKGEKGFGDKNGIVLWQQQNSGNFSTELKKKMKKNSFLRSARSSSSSSISISSASSACSSSVMEWASAEETELSTPNGFSLMVYAWKK